ncbi:hypothetical protein EDB81DRAFT_839290 [Dactylonectria macrodidyma]|uniref:N-acetyltransferase domain-containing protein n=1 Tax=Dactylonectria macrodidyma TaxID=307937 RepID=A0A9P9FGT9_9HYPO|nr:hypothetical protein EDB81DRAFT_839290 [Dactylonectria macrodidyma]
MNPKNEFATAARDMIFSDGGPSQRDEGQDGDAIDDDGDADEEMVMAKRNFTQLRIQKRNSEAGLMKKVIPFHWAPMLSPLTENDIETCVTLENAALSDPTHRASRENIEYRIRKSGGVCYGLFNTYRPGEAKDWRIATMDLSRPVESGRTDHAKHVMFAHILATIGKHPVITDADMEFPENWRDPVASKGSPLGHQSSGRTVCLHSCAVCPEVQGVGIGKTAMKAYLQLMNESGMADRVALICKPYSVQFYKCFGFRDLGLSTEALAGQGWHAMVLDLVGPRPKIKEEPTRVKRT